MLILTIRTDKPVAEIGIYEDQEKQIYHKWMADRHLSNTIHLEIEEILKKTHNTLRDIDGLSVYRGPGSFTGLRIGITIANTLAYSLNKPIIGVTGDDWIKGSVSRLLNGENEKLVLPEYGSLPHITKPKH